MNHVNIHAEMVYENVCHRFSCSDMLHVIVISIIDK